MPCCTYRSSSFVESTLSSLISLFASWVSFLRGSLLSLSLSFLSSFSQLFLEISISMSSYALFFFHFSSIYHWRIPYHSLYLVFHLENSLPFRSFLLHSCSTFFTLLLFFGSALLFPSLPFSAILQPYNPF